MLAGGAAIQLALEPDGILALVGKRKAARRTERQRRVHLKEASEAVHADDAAHDLAPANGILISTTDGGSPDTEAVLSAVAITGGYEGVEVLHGVSLTLESGQITALLGANGAGKSTLCSVLSGSLRATGGHVKFRGNDATEWPAYRRAKEGVLCVPEARGIFPGLSVQENLAILLRDPADQQKAYERFPILAERKKQHAGLLSGGEQQMLGLAPVLANPPPVLIADEVMLGLAPMIAQSVMDAILELKNRGTAILLAEENAQHALNTADKIVVLELGRVLWSGAGSEASVDQLGAAYLGGSASQRV
jgi:ABC-type branched-subunit amino acid transport system ATPase component